MDEASLLAWTAEVKVKALCTFESMWRCESLEKVKALCAVKSESLHCESEHLVKLSDNEDCYHFLFVCLISLISRPPHERAQGGSHIFFHMHCALCQYKEQFCRTNPSVHNILLKVKIGKSYTAMHGEKNHRSTAWGTGQSQVLGSIWAREESTFHFSSQYTHGLASYRLATSRTDGVGMGLQQRCDFISRK